MLICKRLLNAHSFFYFENFHCVMKLSCFNFCSIYPRNAINVFSDFYTCLSLIKSKHSSSVTRKVLIENNDFSLFGTWLLIFLPAIILHIRRWHEILQTRNLSMASLWYWGPPIDYFQVERFNEVRICSLLLVVGRFVIVLSCFMLL